MTETLPPEIPLTEQDLQDPLLQPLPPEEPLMLVGDDCWEVVTMKDSTRFENLGELFLWLHSHRDAFYSAQLFHRRRGDFV